MLGGGQDPGTGSCLFRLSGVQEVVLPGTLKKVCSDIFKECYALMVVRIPRRCKVRVKELVAEGVKVKRTWF